jgi:hypothetical protein
MSDFDVVRDDLALDALAAGTLPEGDDEVLGLLHAFRTDLEPVAAPAPVVLPLRPRRRRSASLIALSAAAGLILGGITAGAVVTADNPDQLFYAAHKAVLGDPRAADRVSRLLDDAALALAKGDRRAARERLAKAAERLGDVDDPVERDALRDRLRRLGALAVEPVPSATPSHDDDRTPEPSESADDHGGSSGSDDSGSGTSGGSGSDDSTSGSTSGGSGTSGGSDDSGGHGGDVLKTESPNSGSGSGGDDH